MRDKNGLATDMILLATVKSAPALFTTALAPISSDLHDPTIVCGTVPSTKPRATMFSLNNFQFSTRTMYV